MATEVGKEHLQKFYWVTKSALGLEGDDDPAHTVTTRSSQRLRCDTSEEGQNNRSVTGPGARLLDIAEATIGLHSS